MNSDTLQPAPAPLTRRAPRPSAAGFTLMELITAVGIIALLAAVLFPVFRLMGVRTQAASTRLILSTAATAETEFRTSTSQQILHGASAPRAMPFNNPSMTGTGTPAAGNEWFVAQILSVAKSEKILLAVNEHLADTDGNGFLELFDAWEQPLNYYVAYDGSESPPEPRLRYSPTPFLVSRGADGKWGTYDNVNDEPDADAKDNLYSFDVD